MFHNFICPLQTKTNIQKSHWRHRLPFFVDFVCLAPDRGVYFFLSLSPCLPSLLFRSLVWLWAWPLKLPIMFYLFIIKATYLQKPRKNNDRSHRFSPVPLLPHGRVCVSTRIFSKPKSPELKAPDRYSHRGCCYYSTARDFTALLFYIEWVQFSFDPSQVYHMLFHENILL